MSLSRDIDNPDDSNMEMLKEHGKLRLEISVAEDERRSCPSRTILLTQLLGCCFSLRILLRGQTPTGYGCGRTRLVPVKSWLLLLPSGSSSQRLRAPPEREEEDEREEDELLLTADEDRLEDLLEDRLLTLELLLRGTADLLLTLDLERVGVL